MGGGDHHHHHKGFEVPDWRSYQVKGIPELEELQRMLQARGLKDPWIRNEVWRYQPENYGGEMRNAAKSLGRGLKWAAGAMVLTIIYQKFFSGHKEGHHGDGGHH